MHLIRTFAFFRNSSVALIAFFSTGLVEGQTGFVQLNSSGHIQDLLPVESGNFLAFGYNSNQQQQHIIKLDQNMDMIWALSYLPSEIDMYGNHPVALLNDGNYVLLGANPTNPGTLVVVKISPSGIVLFTKEYTYPGNSLNGFVISAASGSDNGFVIGGGTNNFLVKFNSNGGMAWAREFDNVTPAGDKYIISILPEATGYTVGAYVPGINGTDICILQVNDTGDLLSYTQLELDNTDEQPHRLARVADGSLVLLSKQSPLTSIDLLVFVDSSVTNANAIEYQSAGYTYIHDIEDAGNNEIICAGQFTFPSGIVQMLYMKVDNTGNIIWQKASKGISTGLGSNLYTLAIGNNKIVLAGDRFVSTFNGFRKSLAVIDQQGIGLCVDSTFGFVAVPQASINCAPMFVSTTTFALTEIDLTYAPTTITMTRTSFCGTVSLPENPDGNEIDLFYPNPANDVLYLNESFAGEDLLVEIFSVTGQKVFESTEATLEINISELPSSIYFVRIQQNGKMFNQKFVKE